MANVVYTKKRRYILNDDGSLGSSVGPQLDNNPYGGGVDDIPFVQYKDPDVNQGLVDVDLSEGKYGKEHRDSQGDALDCGGLTFDPDPGSGGGSSTYSDGLYQRDSGNTSRNCNTAPSINCYINGNSVSTDINGTPFDGQNKYYHLIEPSTANGDNFTCKINAAGNISLDQPCSGSSGGDGGNGGDGGDGGAVVT